jgi:hypothetical protein
VLFYLGWPQSSVFVPVLWRGNRATPADFNGLSSAKSGNHGIVTDIQPPAG